MSTAEAPDTLPSASAAADALEPDIPTLHDIVLPGSAVAADSAALAHKGRVLDRDARAALSAEAALMLDELLDECLPAIEARLRERLEQQLRAWLDDVR